MILTCENIKEYIRSFSLVISCDTVKNGALRIVTPFNYPNGSYIDLFLTHSGDLSDNYILSDGGLTSDYVADMQFNLWATKKRRILIEDICQSLNIRQSEGQFEILISPEDIEQFHNPIVRLAQACIRISDLILHVDHIIPRSKGGKDELDNYQTLCHICNIGKSNKNDTNLRKLNKK